MFIIYINIFGIVNFSNIIKFRGNALKAFVIQERLECALYRKRISHNIIIVLIIKFAENVFRNGVKQVQKPNEEIILKYY